MEHGEVTPEFIDSMVVKSVTLHKTTVRMASDFYEEQFKRMAQFHKRTVYRYIANRIPLIDHRIEEVIALSKLQDGNIAEMFGVGKLDGERYLILEFYPRTLDDYIEEYRERSCYFDPVLFKRWIREIAAGLRCAHRAYLIHGDLKPPNILINSEETVKLADFGLCKVPIMKGSTTNSNRGTARYMSPEQHMGEDLDVEGLQKCDVSTYGIVLWEMITCTLPFESIEEHRIALVIGANKATSHPPLPRETPLESLVNLLRRCWSPHSAHRPDMEDIFRSILPNVIAQIDEEMDEDDVWRDECEKWATVMH